MTAPIAHDMKIWYSHVVTTQWAIDWPMSRPWFERCMRLSAIKRNGNPRPSLAPDSAEMMSRTALGTCFSAYRPLTMALARIGSVGVMHAEMASASRNVMSLMKRRMKPAEMNQPAVMMGPRSMKSDLASRRKYAAGRSMPANMTWIPITTRVIWNVKLRRSSSSNDVHCHGEIQSSPMGPTAASDERREG